MANNITNSEKLKQIIEALPKKNCGKCGFDNCGKFALVVADGGASPFGCRQDTSVGFNISRILDIPVPESIPAQFDNSQTSPRHGHHGHDKHHQHIPFLFGHFHHRHQPEVPRQLD